MQTRGWGGEEDFVILHINNAMHTSYHYSCVLYLSTQGEDFDGGELVFNDLEEKNDVVMPARLRRGKPSAVPKCSMIRKKII